MSNDWSSVLVKCALCSSLAAVVACGGSASNTQPEDSDRGRDGSAGSSSSHEEKADGGEPSGDEGGAGEKSTSGAPSGTAGEGGAGAQPTRGASAGTAGLDGGAGGSAAVETFDATGVCRGISHSDEYETDSEFVASLEQNGTSLSGLVSVPDADLLEADLTGQVNGYAIQFGDVASIYGFTGVARPTATGYLATGEYESSSRDDHGTWSATCTRRVTPNENSAGAGGTAGTAILGGAGGSSGATGPVPPGPAAGNAGTGGTVIVIGAGGSSESTTGGFSGQATGGGPSRVCSQVGRVATTNASSLVAQGTQVLVADGASGLRVVDASNSRAPSIVGTYDTTGDLSEIAVLEEHVFGIERGAGLRVIDVSTSTEPVLIGSLPMSSTSPIPSAPVIAAEGDHVYVSGIADGLSVIDVSDPTQPVQIGGLADTMFSVSDIEVHGESLYLADVWGLSIVNVANPGSPIVTGTYDSTGVGGQIAVAGDYLYLSSYSQLVILDVSGLEPTSLGSLTTVGGILAVHGNRLYVASYSTLHVLDVANPTNPTELGSCTLSYSPNAIAASDSAVYAAVGEDGVVVIDVLAQ